MNDEATLPTGWAQVLLPAICEINPAKPSANALPADAPVTFVPMPAVDAEQGTITIPTIRAFSEVRNGFTAFRDGDVIMAKITPCMENGKAALARGLQNGLGFGSTEFHVLRSKGAVLPEYVYHFIRQESFRRVAEGEMTGSVGQKRVPASFLEQAELPLPPLAEQRRIVAKVEELLVQVNAARERLARVPTILKRLRQSVLAAACSGRLTADRRGGQAEPGSVDEYPAGWRLTTLGLLAKPSLNGRGFVTSGSRGWAQYVSTVGPFFIRSENINTEYLRLADAIRVMPPAGAEVERTRVRAGDLLLTITGNNVGRTAIVPDECPLAHVSQHVAIIRLIRPCEAPYLWIWLRSEKHGQAQLRSYFYGETKPGLNLQQVKDVVVHLPPLAEQREVVRRAEVLFALADAIEKRVTAATLRVEKLTQAILARAFRGELVPTEAELTRSEGRDYESASALLARIRAERVDISSAKRKRRAGKR